MASDTMTLVWSALGLLLVEEERCRRRTVRRNRTKSRIQQRKACATMSRELEPGESADFTHFARLFPAQFHKLEELVGPSIQRCNTNYRDCISVGERLSVTLRFLTTGESLKSLSNQFRMGLSTVGQIVPETCAAIYQVLREEYMMLPDTAQEWQQVASGFMSHWNFPNCLGALDGKRVNIYVKHKSSIAVMALVDSSYRFLYVDLGCNERTSDGVFRGCTLADALVNKATSIPAPAPLPGSDQPCPYCIVADEAFPFTEYLMKPFANHRLTVEQRIFNYRLSRARGVVDNAFGIMASRFRVLLNPIGIRDVVKVKNIVLACCTLHNFLQSESRDAYMSDIVDQEGPDGIIVQGRWRQDSALPQASLPRTFTAAARAEQLREELCRHFMSDTGAVPFQWSKL